VAARINTDFVRRARPFRLPGFMISSEGEGVSFFVTEDSERVLREPAAQACSRR
jgi:hypothetical protein